MMYNKDYVNKLKKEYKKDDIVILDNMEGEELKKGLKGKVVKVDDIGQIHVLWENGSRLALNEKIDLFYKYK